MADTQPTTEPTPTSVNPRAAMLIVFLVVFIDLLGFGIATLPRSAGAFTFSYAVRVDPEVDRGIGLTNRLTTTWHSWPGATGTWRWAWHGSPRTSRNDGRFRPGPGQWAGGKRCSTVSSLHQLLR